MIHRQLSVRRHYCDCAIPTWPSSGQRTWPGTSLSIAAPYGSRRTHICLESSKNGVSSYRITILRLPDNFNHRTGLQASVGGARIHCMHACVGELILTIIFSYKFKILNNKEKPSATGKLNQWWKQRQLSTCMIIELHFTEKEKEKRTQTRKLKRFLSKSKGCRVVKSTTGPQCKLTRNKHGMVTRLTC